MSPAALVVFMDRVDLFRGLERKGSLAADSMDGFIGTHTSVNEKTCEQRSGPTDTSVAVNQNFAAPFQSILDDCASILNLRELRSREVFDGKVIDLESSLTVFLEVQWAFEQRDDDNYLPGPKELEVF